MDCNINNDIRFPASLKTIEFESCNATKINMTNFDNLETVIITNCQNIEKLNGYLPNKPIKIIINSCNIKLVNDIGFLREKGYFVICN